MSQTARIIDQHKDARERTWVWIADAARMLGEAIYLLDSWTVPPPRRQGKRKHVRCPWIGRSLPVDYRSVDGAGGARQYLRRYVLLGDVEAIREAKRNGLRRPHVPPPPDDEISIHEVLASHPEVTRGILMPAIRKGTWRLGGRKLRKALRPAALADGRVRKVLHFKRQHINELVQHIEAHPEPGDPYPSDASGRVYVPPSRVEPDYGVQLSTVRAAHKRGEVEAAPFAVPGKGELLHYLRDGETGLASFAEQYRAGRKILLQAKLFLREVLAKGPVKLAEVLKQAAEKSIPVKTLHRARRALKVKAAPVGFQGSSCWRLPRHQPPAAEKAPSPALDRAVHFLRDLQTRGVTDRGEMRRQAEAAGISEGSFYRAVSALEAAGPESRTVGGTMQPTESRGEQARSNNRAPLADEPIWNTRPVQRPDDPPLRVIVYEVARVEARTKGPVVLTSPNAVVLVSGKSKGPLNYPEYKVMKALVEAGPDGLSKDQLEIVQADARRILNRLREDPDWAAVIHMANTKGNRYRLG